MANGVNPYAAASVSVRPNGICASGELPCVVNEAEEALLGLGREVYLRGGLLVRPLLLPTIPPNDDWHLTPLTRPWLVEALTCAARFLKWDARAKAYVPIDAPDDVADALLSRGGNWKLPILSGIIKTPFLRRDARSVRHPATTLPADYCTNQATRISQRSCSSRAEMTL